MKKLLSLLLCILLLSSTALAEEWVCPNCGKTNTTNFCTSCGTKHDTWICPNCGTENEDAFCGNCGTARPVDLSPLYGCWKYEHSNYGIYTIFRENRTVLAISEDGQFDIVSYEADNKKITFNVDGKNSAYDYSFTDGRLIIDNISYIRSDDPIIFPVTMNGESMADTIQNEDTVYFKYASDLSEIHRGDIVAVNYPDRGNTIFIKRVMGLPGDEIELRNGYVYINGEKYDEPYINDEYRKGPLNTASPRLVPDDHYFVLGDHRNNSNDSRSIGALSADMIIGVETEKTPDYAYTGTLIGFSWFRSVTIQKCIESAESGWELPEGAELTDQKEEIHHYDSILDHYEETELERTRQVVDHYETYYTYKDNQNGTFSEVAQERPIYRTETYTETVQQPIYKQEPVYATKYYYTIPKWETSRIEKASQDSHEPTWPDTSLASDEQEEYRIETYIFFVSTIQTVLSFKTDLDTWLSLKEGDTVYIIQDPDTSDLWLTEKGGKLLAKVEINK